jgi:sulfite exporter TauE/SafE
MLASITPLGERGRSSRWGVTVAAFVLGATLAAGALGALVGAAGSPLGGGNRWRLMALAGAALGVLVLDLGPGRVPGPNRQVNERWLDEYRGWVYGLGFGTQLGLGVTTIVTSAATYLALLAALLTGDPVRGMIVAGAFGLTRGLTLLVAAGIERPDQLLALHRRLARLRRPTWVAAHVLIAAVPVVAVGGAV